MTTWVTAVLAGVLAIGTVIGVVQAVDSTSTNRVPPSSNAPVYGTP